MISTYLAGHKVHANLAFIDEAGNPLQPASAEFNIVNENDEVIMQGTVDDIGGAGASIVIPSQHNELQSGVVSGARVVTLTMHLEDGRVFTNQVYYYLKRENALEVGNNTFVTFPKTLAHIPTMTGVNWNGNRRQLETALMEAYERLCSLPIQVKHFPKHGLHLLTADDWATVSPRVRTAFEKAQIVEAFDLLTDDPNRAMRDQRIFSRSVGESTTTFFSEKAIDHGVSRRAWRLIARYMDNSVVLVR